MSSAHTPSLFRSRVSCNCVSQIKISGQAFGKAHRPHIPAIYNPHTNPPSSFSQSQLHVSLYPITNYQTHTKMCPTLQHEAITNPKSNLRSAFDVLDADGDGKISYDDLRAFYGGISGSDLSGEDEIGSMISVADSDKDGYVQYDEFEKVLNGRKGKKRNERICVMEDAFKVMDKDGDGKVGHADLKSYLNLAGFEAHDEDVKAMITLGGGDENGGVTFEGLLKILSV